MTIGADRGEIAEVGAPTLLPRDPVDTRRAGRWTGVTIAIAAACLALFNAQGLGGWVDEMTPGPLNAPLRAPVAAWVARTQALDNPRATLRRWWQRARAARFGTEQPGQQGAAAG